MRSWISSLLALRLASRFVRRRAPNAEKNVTIVIAIAIEKTIAIASEKLSPS